MISGAALNQYLITGTEERLACVCVCVCTSARVCVRGTRQGAGQGPRSWGGVGGGGGMLRVMESDVTSVTVL